MSESMFVYMVGQICAIAQPIEGYGIGAPQIWEFSGVFFTQDEAIKACRDWTYFVFGPIAIGAQAPHETTPDWTQSFFPHPRPADSVLLPGEVYDVPA